MSPLEVAIAVARAFEAAGVGSFLGVSMASSFQGPQIAALKTSLGPDFEVDEVALEEAGVHSAA